MSQQLTFFAPTVPPQMPTQTRKAVPKLAPSELAEIEASFETFWKAWPKRPNQSKAAALEVWKRAVKVASAAEIMAGLARYEVNPDPRYRPHAATWLNPKKRNWECENEDLTIDAYGLAAWLDALPHEAGLSPHCYDLGEIRNILVATGWEPSWRGPLDALNGWLRDGFIPDSIARTIAEAVAKFEGRASLAAFDKRVRYRSDRINLQN